MVAMNTKYVYNTNIFGCIADSKEIPAAKPMFSG